MIDDDSRLAPPNDAGAELGEAPPGRDVTGNEVLTEQGKSLGQVKDVVVLVGTDGEVVGYEIETPSGGTWYIPLPSQLAVSGSTLVVPDATQDFVEADLVGLGAAVDEVRAKLGIE
jgi:sporulation protein YlmC with PRC-barrel domain